MDLFYAESAAQLGSFGAQNLALVAAGLAAMRRKPRQDWVERFLARAAVQLPECRYGCTRA